MSDDYKPVLRAGSDPVVFFKYPGANDAGNVAVGHVMVAALSPRAARWRGRGDGSEQHDTAGGCAPRATHPRP